MLFVDWCFIINDFSIAIGDKIAQGIFTKFLTCGEEITEERSGGLGSTGK